MTHAFGATFPVAVLAAALAASAPTFAATPGGSAPAFAESLAVYSDDAKAFAVVRYEPADLHSAMGAAKVAFLVRTAGRKVCGSDHPLVTDPHHQRCEQKVIDQALAALEAPLLADALGRTPKPVLAAR